MEAPSLHERLGLCLRRRREELGLSQASVAEQVGKTQTWVSYLEAGKRNPDLADLDRLLRALDLRLELVDIWRPGQKLEPLTPLSVRVRDLDHEATCAIFVGDSACDCGAVVGAVLSARDEALR